MKLTTKWIRAVFAVLAVVLAVTTVAVAFGSLDAAPVMLAKPEAAAAQAKAMLDAVCAGDFDAADDMLHGSPDLGAGRTPKDAVGVLLWDAFVESLDYEISGECYADSQGLALDVTITALEITSVTETLAQRSEAMLPAYVEAARDVSQVYDENNNYREDFVLGVLYDAAQAALEEDARYTTSSVTLHLTHQGGQWWIIPEQGLLKAISGGIAG